MPFCDPHCAFLWFIPLFVIILVRILARPSRSRYLELGAYVWGGTLNQPSGTIIERLAKAKADPKLFVNREIFNQFSAAREAEFEEKLAKLRASSR